MTVRTVHEWTVEDDQYRVTSVRKPRVRWAKTRVYVFGQVDVEPPAVFYEPLDEQSAAVWRSYRRAQIKAMRQAARDAVHDLTGIKDLGRLKLLRDGYGFVADVESHADLFVTIKKGS